METRTLDSDTRAALIESIEMSIDMYNDMATDPLHFTPSEIRELATKSDERIRENISLLTREVYNNVDKLVSLQMLLAHLKSE